ncbi:hypothetical protein Sme01_32750 [Sphaerisporangium melleum]|uniref:Uncharacterized protein n=1 Tax=Sphaerisporangium melleum TaxID=321316 RepID=A0A917VSE5_9ACTN|nr:hypothetical protein [Sphaerisporangium melleum]GGL09918.1 hypothetical protein GCM10007964_60140 [Sphaerisporangium melleum]GII70799.1 hypothetical protein Sme01_32750 [Sphaerisporangium melleum]
MAHGLHPWFAAQWVGIEDGNEVAQRLRVPVETMETCDFQTAMESYAPTSETLRVWITSHVPGWSHVLVLSGWTMPSAEVLSRGGRRVFEIAYTSGVEEIEPMGYTHDGVSAGDIFQADEYHDYWADLPYDDMMPPADELEQYLVIVGRITERFLDRDWFSAHGLLCTIPDPG